MDADRDLLLTAVYVTADDLLPERKRSQLADAADHGYCASHSRFSGDSGFTFWLRPTGRPGR